MKVTLERNHLLKSLGHVHRVVERRTTYPILANVLITAANDGLQLRATDLDIEITENVPAMVSTPGSTSVPANMLYEIVRKLADGAEINLETDETEQMKITSGRSRFFLSCLAADGFPELAADDLRRSFEIANTSLLTLIERTQFAISTEETRYYLNGIFLHTPENSDEPVLRAVATDGHRLARADTEAPTGSVGMPGIIVPRKTVAELQKLLDGEEKQISVELSETKIKFTIDSVVLVSKLIEGTFPDYEGVTPTNNDKVMIVDRGTFALAVDRVSTISSDRGGKAVKLSASDGLLELSVTNPDHGTANEEVAVDFEETGFEIGFNARYLLDIVSQIKSENVQFKFADSGSPTLVTEENNTSALYVLMPMRV